VDHDGEGSEEEYNDEPDDEMPDLHEEAADVMLEDQPDSEEEEESDDDDCPEELTEALEEANVLLTRAKKQRAEVEKARGFFKKGAKQDGRDDKVGAMKNKLPCSKCGQLGHWHKDKNCPKFNEPFKDGKRPGGRKPFKKHKRKKPKFRLVNKRKRSHKAHQVYVTTQNGTELPHAAYGDTACAKSVGGEEAAVKLMKHIDDHGGQYALVDEKEPFRFGPGKRIWSKRALVVTVNWGGQVVVLRFSLVEQDVPFLISKYVFKRLGGVLDLDANTLTLKKLGGATEPLHDLVTGHVGLELVKEGQGPAVASQETVDLCKGGDEVTVENPEHRKLLGNIAVANCTHVVDLPNTHKTKYMSESDSENDADIEPLDSDSSGDECAECESAFLMNMLHNKPNARTRAAPFFSELLPGWRARARELAPPYKRRDEDGLDKIPVKARMEKHDIQRMDASSDDDGRGVGSMRSRASTDETRRKANVDLAHEKGRTDRGRKARVGDDSDSSSEGDGSDVEGTDKERSRRRKIRGRSTQPIAEGSQSDEEGRIVERSNEAEFTVRVRTEPSRSHSPDKGRCKQPPVAERFSIGTDDEFDAKRKQYHQAIQEECITDTRYLPKGQGRELDSGTERSVGRRDITEAPRIHEQDDEYATPRGKVGKGIQAVKKSLAWARTFVADKAFATTNPYKYLIEDQSLFAAATKDKESFTVVIPDTKVVPTNIDEGLPDAVWRKTSVVETGEVLESRRLPDERRGPVRDVNADLKVTVWYGKANPASEKTSKVNRRLMKGMRLATGIFLLEATVLLAAGCSLAGSWTQRVYGTNTADVWEVFTEHSTVTNVSWRQGWRVLDPLTTSNFAKDHDYIDVSLAEKAPRVMVMESPEKIW
jgi:hypothetical protein